MRQSSLHSTPQDNALSMPRYVGCSHYRAAHDAYQYVLQLGLMGVTVLYSSGDGGVAGNDDLCLLANGTQSEDGTIFNPMFPGKCYPFLAGGREYFPKMLSPGTCPFVTGVGGTQLDTGSKVCI